MSEINHHTVWEKCIESIKEMVTNQSFKMWFEPIKPVLLKDFEITIAVPSQHYYEYLESNYLGVLKKVIHDQLGPLGRLKYQVLMDKGSQNRAAFSLIMTSTKAAVGVQEEGFMAGIDNENSLTNFDSEEQHYFDINLDPNHSFESYIEGSCNRLARSAGIAVADRPGVTSFNPLFVYGGTGLGKTHLVQAIGNYVKENTPNLNVRYVSAEKFGNQFIQATQKKDRKYIQLFADYYSKADVLIIDDIQFFASKEKTQEIFFQIFNHLHQNKKQLILTSDRAPKDLNDMQERLLSRLKWGLSVDVQFPDFDTRVAIIRNKMEANGIQIPDNVVDYIAHNVESNVREMEGIIIRLIAHATLMRKEIDLDLAKQTVQTLVQDIENEVSIDYIQKIVSEYFNITLDEIKGKSRKQEIVLPRQIAMFYAKEMTNYSLKAIGNQFGGRDHSTVIHAIQTVNNLLENDKKIEKYLDDLSKKLKVTLTRDN